MRPIILITFFLASALSSVPVRAQDNGCTGTTFTQLYRDSLGRDVRLTTVIPYRGSQGDLLIGGMVSGDLFLSRISKDGQLRWRRSFRTESESTELTTLNTLLIDGEGMIAGVGLSYKQNRRQGYLFRYDPLANQLLYFRQPAGESELTGLVEGSNNEYLISGAALNLRTPLFSRLLLQRVSRAEGTPVAPARLIDLDGEENAFDLIRSPGGGYLIAGNASYGQGAGSTRALLLRTDDRGNIQYAGVGPVAAGENARLYGYDVEIINATIYLLQWGDIGIITGAENTSVILSAFTLAGEPQWTRRLDINEFTGETGIEMTSHADGLLVYGFSLDANRDIFLMQISLSGRVDWAKRYGFPGRAQVFQRASQQMLATSDGIYLTATYSFAGHRAHEGLLLRLNAQGESDNECLQFSSLTVTTAVLPAVWLEPPIRSEEVSTSWATATADSTKSGVVAYDDCDISCEECTLTIFSSRAICAGDSAFIAGRWVNSPGIIIDSLSTPRTGCDSLAFTEVLQSAGPTATYRLSRECGLDSVRVAVIASGGVPPYDYAWSDPSIQGSSPTLAAGSYYVTVNDRASCTHYVLPVEVTFSTDESISLIASPPSCFGAADGTIALSSSGSVSLKLINDSTFTKDRINGLSAGTYSLIVRTASGCEVYREVMLTEPPPLDVSVEGPNFARLGDRIEFTASVPPGTTGVTYQWTPATHSDCPNCGTSGIMLPYDTLVSVRITSPRGCTASDSLLVHIDDTRPRVFLPTAFSPNRDGTNDRWVPGFGREISAIIRWQVFNRWGDEVWSYDPRSGEYWGGGAAGAGLYVYSIAIQLINGVIVTRSGEVHLLR